MTEGENLQGWSKDTMLEGICIVNVDEAFRNIKWSKGGKDLKRVAVTSYPPNQMMT